MSVIKSYLTSNKIIQCLKIIPLTRIATMLIVAILSCVDFGINTMIFSIICVLAVCITQISLCSMYNFHENAFQEKRLNILAFVPSVLLFVCFTVYSLLSGHDIIYSISISLALAGLLMPRPQKYSSIISYILNKEKYIYSDGIYSCEAINKCKCLDLNGELLNKYSKSIDAVSTMYFNFTANELSSQNDYMINILKEFSAVLYHETEEFKSFFCNVNTDYDYYIKPETKDDITYAVLKNKSGFRVIASASTDKLKALCSEIANRNTLSKLSEDKHEIDESVLPLINNGLKTVSFAFCDMDEFTDINETKDMIFAGTLGIKYTLDDKVLTYCKEIALSDCKVRIKCSNDNKYNVINTLKTYGLTDFTENNLEITFNKNSSDTESACYDDNKIIFSGSSFSRKDNKIISFNDLKENADSIYCKAQAIERNINIFSVSIIITFLVASMLVPNNVMHPYVIVLLSCFIELSAMFSLYYMKAQNKNHIFSIIKTFIISICGLGLFIAGRFFIDVPVSKFDAEAVNVARMMLIDYYILLSAMYDSIAVFSEPKKHLKNIIFIFVSVLIVLLLNIKGIGTALNFHHLSLDAIKHVILFALVPVLVNGSEMFIINRREKTDNGKQF